MMSPFKCIGALFCVLVLAQLAHAQNSRSWTAHTSFREVTGLSTADGGVIWVASTGGVFSYDPGNGEINRYTAAEGLYDINVQALAWDTKRQVLWVGYVNGIFDRLDVSTGDVSSFFDIYRSERFPTKTINAMEVLGDSLLIATGFGLVVFDPVDNEVRDTYSRLGTFTAATAVNDVAVNTIPSGERGLWLGTDAGVAFASLSGQSLQDPSSWTSERSFFPNTKVTHLVYQHDRLYVGTIAGLGKRTANGMYERVGTNTRPILDLDILDDQVLAVTQFRLRAYDINGVESIPVSGYEDLQSVGVDASGNVWLGDADSGLSHYIRAGSATSLDLVSRELYPAGPFDSPFGDLAISPDGNLWAAAQLGVPRSGFYRMKSGHDWTNFTGRFVEELSGRGSYWRVHVDGQGNAWAASRGAGLAQVSPEDVVTVYDQSNSTLLPAAGTQSYIIVGGVASEQDGTLWVTNTISPYPLHVRSADGTWSRLLPPQCSGTSQTTALGDILVDSNGIKWIVLLDQGNLMITRGVLVLDTNDTPEDGSDDVCTYYSEPGSNGVGFPGSQISSLTEDLSGRIWVGTNEGPAYFRSTAFSANDPSIAAVWPIWQDRTLGSYVLNGLAVNDIAVDPSNRLWMATPEGAYLLSEGVGFELVELHRADNSPLFSDVVITAAVEALTGRVFLGTDKGLVSLLGDAIQPAEQAQDLFVYPNPAEIHGQTEVQIYIEGLVAETEISIVAVHGELIRRMQARGGRISWDGRDQNGQLVPSGMYLIVAQGRNDEGNAYGKVAIIR